MNDIIVSFDDAQGGFGDILFAAKLAAEIKKDLISRGQLIGDVYLVCNGNNRFLGKMETSRSDLEFGINFITTSKATEMMGKGELDPYMIIEAPTPATIPIQPKNKTARIISAREYSYGPFETVKLGTSYKTPPKSRQREAHQVIQEDYKIKIEQDEADRVKKYNTTGAKETIRTGLINELNEEGILLTDELTEIAELKRRGDQDELSQQKESMMTYLPERMRNLLLQGNENLRKYEEKTELSYGYSHRSSADFLKIHSGYIKSSNKNQDVFLSGAVIVDQVKKQLEDLKEELIKQGFTKIIFHNYDSGDEESLYDSGKEGKVYRLMYTNGIPHPQVIALTAISGPLCLASGDQSLGEAISSDKLICYETFPHKVLLYSAYEERAEALSKDTQDALKLMSLSTSDDKTSSLEQLQALGENLRTNDTVRSEISLVNKSIIDKGSLGKAFTARINDGYPPVTHPIDKAIIEGTFDPAKMLEQVEYPKHLFLAIRYGKINDVEAIVAHKPACLTQQDSLGNNAFIVAAQHNQYKILQQLVERAHKLGIPFADTQETKCINAQNKHFAGYTMCDYLSPLIRHNEKIRNAIFGAYSSDVEKALAARTPKVEVKKAPPLTVSLGFFHHAQKPVNIWKSLEENVVESFTQLQENEFQTKMTPFLVVAREYLKGQQPKYEKEYMEVCAACKEMKIPENWAYRHVEEYRKMLTEVELFIKQNDKLIQEIGTEWLPEPTKTLWAVFEDKFSQESEDSLKPLLAVLRDGFKDRQEELGDYESCLAACDEVGVKETWGDDNIDKYNEALEALQEIIIQDPELKDYGTDWLPAAKQRQELLL